MKSAGFTSWALLDCALTAGILPRSGEFPPSGSVLICFFPVRDEGPGGRNGMIAPFALKNHYKEIINRLRSSLKEAGPPFDGYSRKELRFFSNSSLPEKELAAAAGLGFRGRNTLLITMESGSRGLLGGVIFPDLITPARGPSPSSTGCGNCRRCEESCPGGALKEGKLDRSRCLQHWTTSEGPLPDKLKEVWGERIYGCMICQDCCPWNRKEPMGSSVILGEIDPEPDLEFYLTSTADEVKERFRGTTLGMGWVKGEYLIRNALVSAGWSRRSGLRVLIENHRESDDRGIRDAALWALKRIEGVD